MYSILNSVINYSNGDFVSIVDTDSSDSTMIGSTTVDPTTTDSTITIGDNFIDLDSHGIEDLSRSIDAIISVPCDDEYDNLVLDIDNVSSNYSDILGKIPLSLDSKKILGPYKENSDVSRTYAKNFATMAQLINAFSAADGEFNFENVSEDFMDKLDSFVNKDGVRSFDTSTSDLIAKIFGDKSLETKEGIFTLMLATGACVFRGVKYGLFTCGAGFDAENFDLTDMESNLQFLKGQLTRMDENGELITTTKVGALRMPDYKLTEEEKEKLDSPGAKLYDIGYNDKSRGKSFIKKANKNLRQAVYDQQVDEETLKRYFSSKENLESIDVSKLSSEQIDVILNNRSKVEGAEEIDFSKFQKAQRTAKSAEELAVVSADGDNVVLDTGDVDGVSYESISTMLQKYDGMLPEDGSTISNMSLDDEGSSGTPPGGNFPGGGVPSITAPSYDPPVIEKPEEIEINRPTPPAPEDPTIITNPDSVEPVKPSGGGGDGTSPSYRDSLSPAPGSFIDDSIIDEAPDLSDIVPGEEIDSPDLGTELEPGTELDDVEMDDVITIPTDLTGVRANQKAKSSNSKVWPVVGGLGAAAAAGVGAKIYMDNKKNNENGEEDSDEYNEDEDLLADEWNEGDDNNDDESFDFNSVINDDLGEI